MLMLMLMLRLKLLDGLNVINTYNLVPFDKSSHHPPIHVGRYFKIPFCIVRICYFYLGQCSPCSKNCTKYFISKYFGNVYPTTYNTKVHLDLKKSQVCTHWSIFNAPNIKLMLFAEHLYQFVTTLPMASKVL